MEFIAGAIIGGLIAATLIYIFLKGRYEKEIVESYNRGYAIGSEREKSAILNYIELLKGSDSSEN